MRRPTSPATFAAIATVVLLAVVCGALLTMPPAGPTRVVHVNTDRTTP